MDIMQRQPSLTNCMSVRPCGVDVWNNQGRFAVWEIEISVLCPPKIYPSPHTGPPYSHTHCEDLTPLSSLTALEALDLSHTRAANLSPLSALRSLVSEIHACSSIPLLTAHSPELRLGLKADELRPKGIPMRGNQCNPMRGNQCNPMRGYQCNPPWRFTATFTTSLCSAPPSTASAYPLPTIACQPPNCQPPNDFQRPHADLPRRL